MLINGQELFDILVSSIAIAFIFQDFFKQRSRFSRFKIPNYSAYSSAASFGNLFNYNFKMALIYVSPTIILHELGHKLTAMAFGYAATFHAAYTWLVIGVLLKLFHAPFLFLVPAYVSTSAQGVAGVFVALAGPFTNLLLSLISPYLVKWTKNRMWYAFGRINWFLFLFNILPIPGFDGFHALLGLIHLIF